MALNSRQKFQGPGIGLENGSVYLAMNQCFYALDRDPT